MSNFSYLLKEFSNRFNQQLSSFFPFPDGSEKKVVEAMFYSLSNGGKRLRPYLVCQTAKLFGIPEEKSLITAVALECLHSYSLIHDDLPAMDNDDLRRGKPTCHKQFDEATAILAGDGLLTYAFELISSEKNPFSAEIRCRLANLLAQRAGAFNGMVAGQMLDLLSERSHLPDNPEQIIHHIEEMKTGCLLSFACEAGAILGNATQSQYDSIKTYARKIGIAFQISDDILDVEGTVEQMGKTLGKDSAQNKLTFVSLYGLEKSKLLAQNLIKEAHLAISDFGKSAQNLHDLADFIINRNH